ncbi:MAG: DUF3995 domain-containing protein [Opitutae bacterium]|nr:DUF3995 domain-containing protein [Opitutae bacterium]
MQFVAILLATVFALIAGLHIFWGLGGRWGGSAAVPKLADGQPLFVPGIAACFVVASGLGAFAFVCLSHAGLTSWPFSRLSSGHALWVMAAIFLARTVGDFRYFGLARRVTGTDFARLDRIFYTPLCAGLSLMLAWLAAR